MKCNSKIISQLSASERKRLINTIKEANGDFLKQQCSDMKIRITNNLFKLFCVSANESCGIGSKRIIKIFNEINNLIDKSKEDEIFWQHLEGRCRQILGDKDYYDNFTDNPFNFDVEEKKQ